MSANDRRSARIARMRSRLAQVRSASERAVLDQALCVAAWDGDIMMCQRMLEEGASVQCKVVLRDRQLKLVDGRYLDTSILCERTPLYNAARMGHYAIVQLLLNSCGESTSHKRYLVSMTTKFGDHVLHEAARINSAEILELVLPLSHDIDVRECDGLSPLMAATSYGTLESSEFLIAAGASLHLRDNEGCAMLHWAATPASAALLIKYGADVDATTPEAPKPMLRSPLFAGVRRRQPGIVEVLIKNGANITLRDGKGQSALEYAESIGSQHCAAMLKSARLEFWSYQRRRCFQVEALKVFKTLMVCNKYLQVPLPLELWYVIMGFLRRDDFGSFTHNKASRWYVERPKGILAPRPNPQ